MNHEKVMRKALKVLELISQATTEQFGQSLEIVYELRAALAEPQIDPVDEYRKGFIAGQIDMRDREQAEPVAWMNGWGDLFKHPDAAERGQAMRPLYAAPPQRKPLTDKQKLDLATNWFAENWAIAAAIGLLHDYDTVQAREIGE